jgi:hypothetical protein
MTVPGNLSSPLLATAAAAGAAAAGPIKSLRFNNSDSANLSRTFSSAGNRRTWTWSGWVKRGKLGTGKYSLFGGSGTNSMIRFNNDNGGDQIRVLDAATGGYDVITDRKFRDPSAFFHLVVALDTSQSTAADRVKIYVNGVQETSFASSSYPTQNAELTFNNNISHTVGYAPGSIYHDGLMADIYFIDGSALDPTSFGAYDDNGVWQAIGYSGTYGTNGFHLLDFENEATVGHDSSGNENDFTANNISTTAGAGNDVLFDVPTNGTQSDTGAGGEVSGNYCVLSPLNKSTGTLSNGNLDYSISAVGSCRGTMMVSSGKWYFEVTLTASGNPYVGIAGVGQAVSGGAGYVAPNAIAANNEGSIYYRYGGSTTYPGKTVSIGTGTIGIAIDVDNKKMWWSKNGTWYKFNSSANQTTTIAQVEAGNFSTSFSNLEGDFFTVHLGNSTTNNTTYEFNGGQRAFAYSAPSGYKALCTTNLPTPTIANSSAHFNAVTYTGNNTARSITGVGHNPDWVWIKDRSSSYHILTDSVRGVGKQLYTNTNDPEASNTDRLTSFDSDGFSIATNTSSGGVNTNNTPYVAWCWDAGTSTASNTDGSITSSVRANQTAGFSIVAYTGNFTAGATVGHGLNVKPEFIIFKNRSGTINWGVYNSAIGATKKLRINSTEAASTTGLFENTEPTSSVFSVGDSNSTNGNGNNMIAYCISPVAGFSAVGSYTGNSGQNFQHLGFQPRWIMIKTTSITAYPAYTGWAIFDTAREPGNVNVNALFANSTQAEGLRGNGSSASAPDFGIDILSNGFCLRDNGASEINLNGEDYIYLAFASSPFSNNGGLAR